MTVSVAIADARKARTKRNAPERKRLADYKATAAAIEDGFGGATAGTIARMRGPPITRISLDIWTQTAADSIQYAFTSSVGVLAMHDPSLGIRREPRPDGADANLAKHTDCVQAYRQWRIDLSGTPELATAMAVLVDEVPLVVLDCQGAQRKGTAKIHLMAALRHYAALLGNTPRGARNWRFTGRRLLPVNK